MKCSEMGKISKLYESGEADYFQRKAFEKHAGECPSCRKKYREAILLSALLLSSAKTADRNYFAETLGAYFIKGIFIAGIISMISFTAVSVVVDSAEKIDTQKANANANRTEYQKTEPEAVEIQVEKIIEKKEPNSTIKIRAEDGNKSVNIEIDNETMKINKRIENISK